MMCLGGLLACTTCSLRWCRVVFVHVGCQSTHKRGAHICSCLFSNLPFYAQGPSHLLWHMEQSLCCPRSDGAACSAQGREPSKGRPHYEPASSLGQFQGCLAREKLLQHFFLMLSALQFSCKDRLYRNLYTTTQFFYNPITCPGVSLAGSVISMISLAACQVMRSQLIIAS